MCLKNITKKERHYHKVQVFSEYINFKKNNQKVFDFTALKMTTHIRWTLPSTLFLFRALLAKNGSNPSFLWIIKQPLNLHLDFVGGSWNFPGWLPRKKIGSKNWIFFSCFGTGFVTPRFLKPRFQRLDKILGAELKKNGSKDLRFF